MAKNATILERAERRAKVADLHLKGYSNLEIINELKSTATTISADITYLRKQMDAKAIRKLEYRKKRALAKVNLIQKKAWDIFDNVKNENIKLAAQRVIISALELGAKVDGLIQEKLTIGPEQASQKLLKELKDLEVKAQGNGNKELTDAVMGSEKTNI